MRETRGRAATTRFGIGKAMIVVVGSGLGSWLLAILQTSAEYNVRSLDFWFVLALWWTWGISIIGPPLLYRGPRRYASLEVGERLWVAQGVGAWLVALPIFLLKLRGTPADAEGFEAGVLLAAGFPAVALLATLCALAEGGLPPGTRGDVRWTARFGLRLNVATGLIGLAVFVATCGNVMFTCSSASGTIQDSELYRLYNPPPPTGCR
jgi:hypothetical protein